MTTKQIGMRVPLITAVPPHPFYQHLQENIIAVRRDAGLSRADLAGITGLTEGDIMVVETGHAIPKFYYLWLIACACGVSLDCFVKNLSNNELFG